MRGNFCKRSVALFPLLLLLGGAPVQGEPSAQQATVGKPASDPPNMRVPVQAGAARAVSDFRQDQFAPKDSASSIPEGYRLIEGDILVPVAPVSGTYVTNLWPNGIVPYEFDANVTAANAESALVAMAEWESIGYGNSVIFIPLSGHPNYIHIQNSTINNSQIGMQGGSQVINIVSWNSRFVIAHELGHALAYWHEQSRSDRNTYIQVNYDNICQTCCSGGPCDYNFDLRTSGDEWGPYDFDSVMHYGQCSWIDPMIICPSGGTTLTVLPPNEGWQSLIGQRTHLSDLDRTVMSFLYPLSDWTFVDQTSVGAEDGSFYDPYTTFADGYNNTPSGGTVWIVSGDYAAAGTWSQRRILQAPLGGVVLQ